MDASPISLLAFDLGGVLLSSSAIHGTYAQIAPANVERLDAFQREIRHDLWSGALSEADYWQAVAVRAGVPAEPERWRALVTDACTPLPAVTRLAAWTALVPLAVLSNHRHEWLEAPLAEHGILPFISKLFISDLVGRVKPDRDAFGLLTALAPANEVLFVDDQQQNLDAAAALGIQTLHADEDGRWIAELDRRLGLA